MFEEESKKLFSYFGADFFIERGLSEIIFPDQFLRFSFVLVCMS